MSLSKKGRATEKDVFIGSRIRFQRNVLGFSQEKLADLLGITFQQVQKYEQGTNRISAANLNELSKVFQVPLHFFFPDSFQESGRAKTVSAAGFSDNNQTGFGEDILARKETGDLLRLYYSIPDPNVRKKIVTMVEAMADSFKNDKKKSG